MTPTRIFGKIWMTPYFSPLQTWKLVPPLLYPKFCDTLCALNLKCYYFLCTYHLKDSLYYHLGIICTKNVHKGFDVFCHRQIVEESFDNLSLKVPILSLSIPKFDLKSWVPLFHFENPPPPLSFSNSNIFSGSTPFLKFTKFWSHLFYIGTEIIDTSLEASCKRLLKSIGLFQ